MLDVHAPHEPVHTWKGFFIHIATIVIGLLIAIALEQVVEAVHRHHQAQVARAAIGSELEENLQILKQNQQRFIEQRGLLQRDLDTLESTAPDADAIAALKYSGRGMGIRTAAWNAAMINGSLSLLPLDKVQRANYLYHSFENEGPAWVSYSADISSASALVEHCRSSGRLSPAARQQLLVLTVSALGRLETFVSLGAAQVNAIEAARWDGSEGADSATKTP